ncbi:MAG TPA: hypothetical protein VFU19_09440 [Iamia sp.]|nr:hypothetical protein [Iamia sp.]
MLTGDVLDMRTLQPDDLIPKRDLSSHMFDGNLGGMSHALHHLTRWSQGFHGSDRRSEGWRREVRIHRDGAVALAFDLASTESSGVSTPKVYRLANLSFRYLAWLWQETELRSDVEVIIDVVGHRRRLFSPADPDGGYLQIEGPAGVDPPEVTHREVVAPHALRRASLRHGLVMAFADRLHQALGEPQAEAPFRRGILYGRDGAPIDASLGPDGIRSETMRGANHMASVHDRGEIVSHRGVVVGWHRDGVVMNLAGDAVAVVGLAPGAGCPDDFVAKPLDHDVDGAATRFRDTPTPFTARHDPPAPTGCWSMTTLADLVEHGA